MKSSSSPRPAIVLFLLFFIASTSGEHLRAAEAVPENLAPKAKVSATSINGENFLARFATDGKWVSAGAGPSGREVGTSWAVLGDKAQDKADFTLVWDEPQQVAEVVYYGRTAWLTKECWKDYQILADDQPQPIATGTLAEKDGPQRIKFPPTRAKKLTLRFLNSHGGPNPGAAEIMVFASSPSDQAFERLTSFAANSLFGDNMVLQRGRKVAVWGTAGDGEEVTVKFRNQSATTTAKDGRWQVWLEPLSVGPPGELIIESAVKRLVFRNVVVGEVWVASGQSNMEMPIDVRYWPSQYPGVMGAKEAVAAADHPNIRLFFVGRTPSRTPPANCNGKWQVCTPETAGNFSAIAYFFGQKLNEELGVPIGLIDASLGATPIETWLTRDGVADLPKLAKLKETIEKQDAEYQQALSATPDKLPGADQYMPTAMYRGMIRPLQPFAIAGAIWYQGEGNVGDGMLYFEKMKALIEGWREAWGQGDFPFYFVQLAPYDYGQYKGPKDPYRLPALWEAQTASLAIPNTGMAVTTDISQVKEIHPANKHDVGRRLARWALAKAYGQTDLVYSGPLYRSKSVDDGKIRLHFDHAEGGLASRDGKPLDWFTIAGKDRKFVQAEAVIEGNAVVVSSNEVSAPVAVRFGWHKLAEPNLMNQAGLPASPFRTDDWTDAVMPE